MLRTRVIPALLLRDEGLIKTVQFRKSAFIGDPCNTVRIFNELEVDELVFLDVSATPAGRGPNFALLTDIANECFMPLGYGGGIRRFEDAVAVLRLGFEKIVINTFASEQPEFVSQLAAHVGSQAVVVSIDVKRTIFGRKRVFTRGGRHNTGRDPVEWAQEVESLGAGEILLTSIDLEGTWQGFDVELIHEVSRAVDIPVIAHGGAGSIEDIGVAVNQAGASAVAVGSMIVFQKKGMGVLVNFPAPAQLDDALRKTDLSQKMAD